MKRQDLRLFCRALAFTATAIKTDNGTKDAAARAFRLAEMIEEFCLPTHTKIAEQTDRMIERIKSDLQTKGDADMDEPQETLARLYERLAQRAARYASEDVLADLALGLLDAEIYYETTHNMRIS